jgi:AraC-like DNA-binding protein
VTVVYHELKAPIHLRGTIACFWFRRGDGHSVRVLPDACVDLVWRPGQGAVLAGPDTQHWISATTPDEPILGVRFLPGAGGGALGLPLEQLRDQRAPLHMLGLPALGDDEVLNGELQPREAAAQLGVVAADLVAGGRPDRAVLAAAVRLRDPSQRVERLAADLGFSERQLRRRFLTAVGYGPKTLQRVLRLQRFLAGQTGDLSRAAFDAGYSDQAHLARDCRRLTGLSPSRLQA